MDRAGRQHSRRPGHRRCPPAPPPLAQEREPGRLGGRPWVLWTGLACLLAGVVVLIVGGGVAAWVAGAVLIGLAGIVLVSFAFLLVGEGEERDRLRHPEG